MKVNLRREFKQSRKAQVSLTILLLVVLTAVFAPQIAPNDPEEQHIGNRLQPPAFMEGGSWEYPLGTNNLGQGILSRIIFGARLSIAVGFAGAFISALIGVPIALISGYYGGVVDEAIMRVADIFLSIPTLLLAVAVISVFQPSPINVIIVFVFVSWAWLARAIRSEVLSVRERGFVKAAKATGASDRHIIQKHVFPNVLSTALVITTLYVGIIILYQAALSYLGLASSQMSWGWMLSVGRGYLSSAWWLGTFPGVAIFITVMTLNVLGDWLRDVFDVRAR